MTTTFFRNDYLMKIFTFQEQLKTNKGVLTNLSYIGESDNVNSNLRIIKVQCLICRKIVDRILPFILAGKYQNCGSPDCNSSFIPNYKKIYTPGEQISENLTFVKEDVERTTAIEKKGYRRYIIVECSCGNRISVRSDQKLDLSCIKCNARNRRKANEHIYTQSNIRHLYKIYSNVAKKRDYQFEISLNEFTNMIKQVCYYCGSPPRNKRTERNNVLLYNGIDRVDNNLGYSKNNVVTCCGVCNYMKNTMPQDVFINHIRAIFENLNINSLEKL